jgi:hypothetical protein
MDPTLCPAWHEWAYQELMLPLAELSVIRALVNRDATTSSFITVYCNKNHEKEMLGQRKGI